MNMEGMLKTGTVLTAQSGSAYRVCAYLGAGTQGEVYEVECGGKHSAVKWYFPQMATRTQREILENLLMKGSPNESFLWPEDLITGGPGGGLGYVMPLRPKEFCGIVDLMKRRAEPSFAMLCRIAFNLTKGYGMLHAKGLSYRDISFGNVSFNPATGAVLIGDNDNVSASGRDDAAVYGTPRFMAPEIVTGREKPSRNTDLYSLAVLLFYMFMLGHPLEGKLEADIRCMDIHALNRLFGTHPVFIFDPNDTSNRPVEGYQDNVLIFWELYPQSLRDLFIQSFTVGLTAPNKRVTEKQWLYEIANMMSCLITCPRCGAEVFFDAEKAARGETHVCWSCRRAVPYPPSLICGGDRALLPLGAKLYSHHLTGNYDMDTVAGEVVANPSDPRLLGIRNLTGDNWTYIRADGRQIPVAPGRSAAIAKDAKINFGARTGEFR